MKILFVYPTRLDIDGSPIKYKKAFLPPLALALLNGLTPKRHDVQVINDIVEDIDFSINYDLVAITAMTTQIGRAYQIADTFRKSNVKIIDTVNWDLDQIDAYCDVNKPDIVIVDQLDKIGVRGNFARTDEK